MPYIGRNHIAGDHTSNFKVLDDISSYTATFDGSSTNIVSTADETIRITEHRFIQGQRVTYSNGGGGNIGGLTNGTAYFVTFDTANTIKLATSLANANNNTNINLSSVGTGSSHTLTAAFDGVNTIFKITHGGGSTADIVNAAQLQIAINNVIQKANQNSSYTEGFFVVDSRKIQFKTAPTADDIFWGNIIANTIDTFDIADLKIDQFTGDGTTTQFTLSRDVPNNQSVMVTLDGVVQHPSDKDTTRAYRILAEKVIEFSSPPPNPCDVQVRHLGFAGASTGDVTGFYGRTGNVVLGASDHITTGDITPRNINASGIVTASSFVGNLTGNVSGNLTVGGVLTYEDVTNVDSIGIITARSDIHVGAGVSAVGVGTFGSLDIGGDIDVDGHTNLDNVSVAGVTTFSDDVVVNFGTGNDLQIYHTSSTNRSYIKEVGSGGFYLQAANLNVMNPAGNETMLRAIPDGAVELYHNNIKHFETTAIGCKIYDDDATAALQFQNSAGLAGLIMGESTNIIGFKDSNPHWLIKCIKDGAVELYHDNSKKLETSSTGITVTGTVVSTGADINGDIDVDGHTNLDNVSIAGVTTITGTLGSGDITITSNQAKLSLTDSSNDPDWSVKNANGNFAINDETAGATRFSINSSNGVEFHMHAVPITDSTYDLGLTGTRFRAAYVDTYYGDGSNLTGIDATQIVTGNTSVQTVDTGSDGHVKITTEGGEKLRITSGGQVNIGGDLTQTTYPLSVLGSTGGNTNINIVQRLKYSGDSNQYNTGTVIAFTNTNTNADAYSYIGARIDSGSSGANANSLVFATNATNTAPTEKLRIDSSGKILSGHTAALTKFHGPASTTKRNPHIQVNGTNVNSASMSLTSWDNNVNGYYGPAIYLAKSGSSTIGTNSRVSNQLSILGSIIFSGDDGDEFVKGAMIQGAVDGGVTTGNNDMPGRLLFLTTKDGAQEPIERLRIDSTGAIMLMQDSNEGSAQQKLQWISNSGSLSAQAAWGQGSANFDFSVFRSDSQTDYPYGNFRVLTGGTSPSESLKVTVGGQVLKPRNPAFRAQGNTHYPNQTSGVDLVYNNEIFDKGSNYNPSNGRFTAPVSGTYFFYYCFLVYPDNDNYWKTLGFKINGSSSYANGFGRGQRGSQESQQISTYLDLNANDYVTPFVDISSGTLDFYMTGGHAHFFGYLVS